MTANVTTKLLSMLIICMFTTLSYGQTRLTAQSIMKFLNLGIGAKYSGMADTYVSKSPDASIVFWNVAGLADVENNSLFFDQNYWFADIKQYSFAYSHSFGPYGIVGISSSVMDYGDIYGTTIDLVAAGSGSFEYVDTGKLNVSNFFVALSYARAISDQFSIGVNMKYAYSDLGNSTVIQNGQTESIANRLGAWAIDLGTWYRTGYKDLSFSMALRNFSREENYPRMEQRYYLPLIFSLGLSVNALQIISEDVSEHTLLVSINGLHPMDYLEKGNLGLEYSYDNRFFLRTGYKINYSLESYSVGLGVRHSLSENMYLVFDYSYAYLRYFSGANRFSLSFSF